MFFKFLAVLASIVAGATCLQAAPDLSQASYLEMSVVEQEKGEAELKRFKLTLFSQGLPEASFLVVSGKPQNQELRVAKESIADTNEPIPEGLYRFGRLRDYGIREHPRLAGIARYFLPLYFATDIKGHPTNPRTDLGIHVDKDQGQDPGTAGCIGMASRAELRRVLDWVQANKVRYLVVDYGLGSLPKTSSAPEKKSKDSSS